jgi:hypothetical protein
MCRNIRVLYNFQPPTTEAEVRAAALQYVRKVSGLNAPPLTDKEAFDKAVDEVAACTGRLLATLKARAPLRTREGEQAKGRARFAARMARAVRST